METQTMFKYADLSDEAKARAVQWYQNCEAIDWEPDLDDYVEALAMLGFHVRSHGIGRARHAIDYEISSHLGYACFTGGWDAQSLDLAKLHAERPTDETLEYIGAQLMAIALRWPTAHCQFEGRGRSCHINCAYSEREQTESTYELAAADERFDMEIGELIKATNGWLCDALHAQYEYATSEENAIAGIEVNDYDFDADGKRV